MRLWFIDNSFGVSLQVPVKNEITVNWSVPRASKQDYIGTIIILLSCVCI